MKIYRSTFDDNFNFLPTSNNKYASKRLNPIELKNIKRSFIKIPTVKTRLETIEKVMK